VFFSFLTSSDFAFSVGDSPANYLKNCDLSGLLYITCVFSTLSCNLMGITLTVIHNKGYSTWPQLTY